MTRLILRGVVTMPAGLRWADPPDKADQFMIYMDRPGGDVVAICPTHEMAQSVASGMKSMYGMACVDMTKIEHRSPHLDLAAAIGAHLMDGFKDFLDCEDRPMPQYSGGGRVGIVSDMGMFVPQLVEGYLREDDHPGVFQYEVTDEVGKMFARYLDEHPDRTLRSDKFPAQIATMIDEFYQQGQS